MLLTTRTPARSSRRSAFTLLEVLVVVAILVILATVATVATTKYIEESRKAKAQLGCATLDKAIKAYTLSQANTGETEEARLPTSTQDLLQPFGTPASFLENPSDVRDPWGKEYQFERRTKPDGITPYILVVTTAPDGTRISQYGLGANSEPKQQ